MKNSIKAANEVNTASEKEPELQENEGKFMTPIDDICFLFCAAKKGNIKDKKMFMRFFQNKLRELSLLQD